MWLRFCVLFYLGFLCLALIISGESNASIVFIHIGPSLPRHMRRSISQAMSFNPTLKTYLLCTDEAYSKAKTHLKNDVHFVSIKHTPKTSKHIHFQNHSKLGDGFWKFTTERFFYLEDFMLHLHLEDVFHLESDNMVYTDLSKFLPIFHSEYHSKIAATFDNDHRVIAGFMYVQSVAPLAAYTNFIHDQITRSNIHDNDMVWHMHFD